MTIRPGQAKGPYVGMSGSGSGSGGIEKVNSLFDPTDGLPSNPAIGDKYLSTATANTWVDGYIYEWTGSAWTGSAPYEGRIIYAILLDQMYTYNDATWRVYPDYWVKPVIAVYDNTNGIPGGPLGFPE